MMNYTNTLNQKAKRKPNDLTPCHGVNYLEETMRVSDRDYAPDLLRDESPPRVDAWMPLYVRRSWYRLLKEPKDVAAEMK